MPLTMTWKGATTRPVEADGLRPDTLAGLSAGEVARLRVPVGNESAEVGELFEVAGDPADGTIHLEGELRPLRRLAMGMASGIMHVVGDVGPHLGRGMVGGSIDVRGAVGDGAGMAMRGGHIRIHGDAGHHLGGAEPGARAGMRDGVILVDGSIGDDAGLAMRRGLIAVAGRCGDHLGRGMIAGSVFAFGPAGSGLGAGMKRGTIALFGPDSSPIAATFAPSGRDRPTFLTIYLNKLREWGFSAPEDAFAGDFLRYNGDRVAGGQGEILRRA